MSFVFQQPGSRSLADALDAAATGGQAGGGMFAFATKAGIETLLSIPNIQRLLTAGGRFHLIVGVDAITNGDALLALEDAIGHFGGSLTAHAFLHDSYGTFHPKFTWFLTHTRLAIVTGSGNLTLSGLGSASLGPAPAGNWEAFSTQSLKGENADAALRQIDEWIRSNLASGNLRLLSDLDVRNQAMANSRVQVRSTNVLRAQRVSRLHPTDAGVVSVPPLTVDVPAVDNDVFIRELPQTRPGQADIGRQGLEFLGYTGADTVVFLQHVELDNSVGPTVEQRLFVNASQNYRVEMSPIARHGYTIDTDDNRMILVAVRLNERSFRYTIIPVTHSQYPWVSALLGSPTARGPGRRMRLLETSSTWLRQNWPNPPENLLPIILYSVAPSYAEPHGI